MKRILLSVGIIELLVILILAIKISVADSQMLKLSKSQSLAEAAMLNAYLLQLDRGQVGQMTNVMRTIILHDIKMLNAGTYGPLAAEDRNTIERSLNKPDSGSRDSGSEWNGT